MNQGFVRNIIIILVAVIALNYIGFDIAEILHSPNVQHFVSSVWDIIVWIVRDYIVRPIIYLWNLIVT